MQATGNLLSFFAPFWGEWTISIAVITFPIGGDAMTN
jgi:hypothetical protein